jgi:hypothetical protein
MNRIGEVSDLSYFTLAGFNNDCIAVFDAQFFSCLRMEFNFWLGSFLAQRP